jgi:Leucine-rich repeat (LRR) protein
MRELYLSRTQLTSIDALAGMTELERVTARGNAIADLPDFQNLTKLYYADFAQNALDTSDLAALLDLTAAETLSVRTNPGIDCSSPEADAVREAIVGTFDCGI